jgi:eukaryotic-like serine/threonine-protein kinase
VVAAPELAEPRIERSGSHVSASETGSASFEPGSILGNYRIERLLGRGGMGAVFLAHDTRLHRLVALKILDGHADGVASGERLLREARNAAALNHQGICAIHEVGEAGGTAFIAMEYVGGRSLAERIEAGALPLEEALRLGIQAADALAHAHVHGVVHRDFKAANAILTDEGVLKVVDFGVARRSDALLASATSMSTLVPPGVAAGTPYAMAPEQVRGDPADARSDIWALGVLLFEMVTGATPFRGATLPALYSSILTDSPAPLPALIPVGLRAVIERCLEKEPALRYQHAKEVRAALEAIQADTVSPWVAWRYHLRRWPLLAAAASLAAVAALLVGLDVGGVRERLAGISPAPPPIKLAVLPFENLTGDPEQEYLSDGLTEELITQLGRLHPQRLSVIARTSAMRYKDRSTPLEQIGRELGVDYVLEGSARREGSRVRISATLIHVADQTQRWTESFDRELAGILALQHDVARGVAHSLALALLPAEEARLAGASRIDPEAYEAYLRGLGYLERGTTATRQTALHFFERALEKDSTFALAHLGIRQAWAGLRQAGVVPSSEAVPKMRAALARALDLDDKLPEVHYALAAEATWTEWDWRAAEEHFRRAIDLNPNYAEARAFYAHYLHIMGRPEEAMMQAERALELDPLNPVTHAITGGSFLMVRRYDEAIAHFQTVLRLSPGSMNGLNGLSNALHYAERYEEALAAERESVRAGRGDPELEEVLGRGFVEAGYQEAMGQGAALLAERARSQHVPATRVARLYLRAGDNERALEWLERAYEARDPGLPYIGSGHKDFDPLRDHPRFRALLREMNLPH